MSDRRIPKMEWSVQRAALFLDKSPRWVKERIKAGELEGFRHSPTDLTVSVDSLLRLQDRARVGAVDGVGGLK